MVGDPLSLLQDQLIVETPDWVVLRRALARCQTGLSGRDLILCVAIDRLADALKTLRECINTGQTGLGVPDVVVLLRQVVRWSHPLKVHPKLWTIIRTEAELPDSWEAPLRQIALRSWPLIGNQTGYPTPLPSMSWSAVELPRPASAMACYLP